MTACLICAEHDPIPGYSTCGRCKQNLAADLSQILDLYALTESELQPGAGTGRGNETPIGLRVAALSLLAGHDLIGCLGSWEADWREVFELAPPPTRTRYLPVFGGWMIQRMPVTATLAEIIGFLQTWLDRACRDHPAIDEFAREVRHLHSQLRIAARVTLPPSWWVDCPADHGDGVCGRRLRVSADLEDTIDCRGCGTTWTTRRLLLVAAADATAEVWLDPAALAEITGIPERTLRRWAMAGVISRDHGRYSLSSVRTAMLGVS